MLDPFWLRSHIGLVTSDYTTIFSASVYENLITGMPEGSGRCNFAHKSRSYIIVLDILQDGIEMMDYVQQVREVMALVGLDGFVHSLPNGYSTILGEHGFSLSLAQVV